MFKRLFGKKTYRFKEPDNTAVFTCSHVLEGGDPILLVSHSDDDGAWQFLCGAEGHSVADGRIVSLGGIVELDPTVADLYEMPIGVSAAREQLDGEWTPFRNQ